jgi:hypothetical protein
MMEHEQKIPWMLASALGSRLWVGWNIWFVSISALLVDVIVRAGDYTRLWGDVAILFGTYTGLVASHRLTKADWLLVLCGTKPSSL